MDKNIFHRILKANTESEHLEFKEAKNSFDFEHKKGLLDYVVAIGNEGGGKLILGITDKRPRKIVGTKAMQNIHKSIDKVYEKLSIKIRIEEYYENYKRVLIIHIPGRPIGSALKLNGALRMRTGGSIRNMTD